MKLLLYHYYEVHTCFLLFLMFFFLAGTFLLIFFFFILEYLSSFIIITLGCLLSFLRHKLPKIYLKNVCTRMAKILHDILLLLKKHHKKLPFPIKSSQIDNQKSKYNHRIRNELCFYTNIEDRHVKIYLKSQQSVEFSMKRDISEDDFTRLPGSLIISYGELFYAHLCK